MALRRPLVNVSGTIREIADGDTLTGFAGRLSFVLSDGSQSNIPLGTSIVGAELPFTLASGATSNIPMAV